MRRLLLLSALTALFAASPAWAATGSITLNQPQPIVAGQTVSFSYTISANVQSPQIDMECFTATNTLLQNVLEPAAGNSFTVTSSPLVDHCGATVGYFQNHWRSVASVGFTVSP